MTLEIQQQKGKGPANQHFCCLQQGVMLLLGMVISRYFIKLF